MDGTSNGMQTEWTDGCYMVYRTWDFSQLFLQCSYADCRNITVNFFEECFLPEQIYLLNVDRINTEYVIMGGGSNSASVRIKTKDFFNYIINTENILKAKIIE